MEIVYRRAKTSKASGLVLAAQVLVKLVVCRPCLSYMFAIKEKLPPSCVYWFLCITLRAFLETMCSEVRFLSAWQGVAQYGKAADKQEKIKELRRMKSGSGELVAL